MHFLAQPTLRADADSQRWRPNRQHRINGGAAGVAVVRGEVPVQLAEVQELIDPAEQMVFQVESARGAWPTS